jgi:hypothetical protein
MSFELVLLVCVLSTTPTDKCDDKTAIDVIKEHREFGSPMDCFAYAGHKVIPILKNMGEDAYFKVKCKPERNT